MTISHKITIKQKVPGNIQSQNLKHWATLVIWHLSPIYYSIIPGSFWGTITGFLEKNNSKMQARKKRTTQNLTIVTQDGHCQMHILNIYD